MTIREHISIIKRSIQYLYYLDRIYTFCMIASAVLSALIPYIHIYMSALIVDELIEFRRIPYLATYVAITVGLSFSLHFMNALLGKIKDLHMNSLYYNESRAFAEKTMALDYDQIEDRDVHLLRERIRMESQTGYGLWNLHNGFSEIIQQLSSVISAIAISVSLFTSPGITIWVKLSFLLAVVLISVVNFLANSHSQKIEMQMFSDAVEYNGLYMYFFDHMLNYKSGTEIRMYGMEQSLRNLFTRYGGLTNDMTITAKKKQLPVTFIGDMMIHLLQFVVYFVVISGALEGGLSVGSIAKYVATVCSLVWSVQELIKSVQALLINNQYLKTYFSFFDLPSHMYQGTLPVEKRAFCDFRDTDYEIEFHNVSFRYPGAETFALRNVSMKFRIGQRLAVVGMNGSGKTTFIKLLCRLYDPTEGEIRLNGIDIRKYDYQEYMGIFSVVFQDFNLFSFSLGHNVAASVDYNRERAAHCLKAAGFGPRLAEMPDGLDTYLYKDFDENGVEISGGEAQKIALARALYKDAPFIILDEPTAALDPIAEAEIYSKFNEIVGDKTAIYISHRLSSCKFCDEIAVFHEGEVIQQGSHESLVADETGKYHELWNAQAQYYTSGE